MSSATSPTARTVTAGTNLRRLLTRGFPLDGIGQVYELFAACDDRVHTTAITR